MQQRPISSYLSGKLVSYKGAKAPAIIGLLTAMLGFISLMVVINYSTHYYWMILPLMAIGFGVAFTIAAVQAVPKHRAGTASGAFTTGRQIGSLIGVTCFGTIISSSHRLLFGVEISLAIASLLFLFGILLAIKLK